MQSKDTSKVLARPHRAHTLVTIGRNLRSLIYAVSEALQNVFLGRLAFVSMGEG